MTAYVPEHFTDAESAVLRRYFTNLDGPVFALVNLPEVVKGALFARYSRSPKSLRRLFLDEFVGDLDITGDVSLDATVGMARAEELYQRVFVDYGDDSVSQLGGVHLACEQASNILTKVLEWGRLMSYLEQSTRCIAYDERLGGRYRFYRDPHVLSSHLGTRYVGDMDRMFDAYSDAIGVVVGHVRSVVPQEPGDSDFVYRQATQSTALDAVRGLLPAAAQSNLGIYGSGQGFESLLVRMGAHPLPEARTYAKLMLHELRKVIPSFLQRVDVAHQGVAWSDYLNDTSVSTAEQTVRLFGGDTPEPSGEVTLVDYDPDGEDKLVAAACYSHVNLPETQILARVSRMSVDDKMSILRAYVGHRHDRRHKPGRGFERTGYRFEVLSDYGAFRDLQRHRMLTIEWQRLTPDHGYTRPELVVAAGAGHLFDETMERSAALYDALNEGFSLQAPYAVSMAYRMRYIMQYNARQAVHMLELRSGPHGHPSYRRVAREMHRQIAEVAGHRAIAGMMTHMSDVARTFERFQADREVQQWSGSDSHPVA